MNAARVDATATMKAKGMPQLALSHPGREQLLTVQEFAALVRVHPWSVYRRIKEDRQPGVVKIGREYRINTTIALASDRSVK